MRILWRAHVIPEYNRALQEEVEKKLASILTEEQKEKLKEFGQQRPGFGARGGDRGDQRRSPAAARSAIARAAVLLSWVRDDADLNFRQATHESYIMKWTFLSCSHRHTMFFDETSWIG